MLIHYIPVYLRFTALSGNKKGGEEGGGGRKNVLISSLSKTKITLQPTQGSVSGRQLARRHFFCPAASLRNHCEGRSFPTAEWRGRIRVSRCSQSVVGEMSVERSSASGKLFLWVCALAFLVPDYAQGAKRPARLKMQPDLWPWLSLNEPLGK